MPAIADMAKASYCREGHFEKCARFAVAQASGVDAVPSDLFPDQTERVETIVAKGKR
jgi:hypothetical protein